jgi:hypothetical protein
VAAGESEGKLEGRVAEEGRDEEFEEPAKGKGRPVRKGLDPRVV